MTAAKLNRVRLAMAALGRFDFGDVTSRSYSSNVVVKGAGGRTPSCAGRGGGEPTGSGAYQSLTPAMDLEEPMQHLIHRRRFLLAALVLGALTLAACRHLGAPPPDATKREGGGGGGGGAGGGMG